METVTLFLKGLIIGFSIAAPVGPIAILCIQRVLRYGIFIGMMSGIGAACADAVYGSIAAFGLTFISDILTDYHAIFRFAGSLFLAVLGTKIFFTPPAYPTAPTYSKGGISSFISTFFLTLANPLTILAFAGVFSSLGIMELTNNQTAASSLVIGVLVGSASWWLLLSSVIGILRTRITMQTLQVINKISGIIMVTFALVMLASTFIAQ